MNNSNKIQVEQLNEKSLRIDIVNQIIELISTKGRRFFYNTKTNFTSKVFEKNKKIYFIDDYNLEEIPLHLESGGKWNKFSHGGTLKALLLDFNDFITTGEKSNHNHGYGGLYCTHWGYPETDMLEIQELAKSLKYL